METISPISPTQPSPEGRALESNRDQIFSVGEDPIAIGLGEAGTQLSPEGRAFEQTANEVKVPPKEELDEVKVSHTGEGLGAVEVSPTGGDLEGAEAGSPKFAAIFDMDGTLIDNTPYHFRSWQMLYKKYGKGDLTKETYYTSISGVPVMETIRSVFGHDHNETGLIQLFNEKEEFYRKEYGPHVVPVDGLELFLSSLKGAGVRMAMASSATVEDIDFILSHVPIRDDFNTIVDSTMASKPKPDPQIFLNAAAKLDMPPESCVVFEDSLAGIKAANGAGMKVVAITTGHTADQLHPVDMVINDYKDLNADKLAALFANNKDE